ncbi:MAG: alpha/beta hydrolase family protein [Pirellulaceae bacterium]
MFTSRITRAWMVSFFALGGLWTVPGNVVAADDASFAMPQRLTTYFEEMSVAKPLVVRTGDSWEAHRNELREFLLECVGLQPLPERVPLDVRMSEPLDHPWCTVRRVSYQLWPGVYSTGLLFMPKQFQERPAPAVLCPHGHWATGNAEPAVQARCLNMARLGYVTFSSTQNHFEDLYVGVSHQTLMVWNNMRALDLLETLPEVDASRIGVAGESGGGLQTQMLVALDPRVKVATIVGLTCDFRKIMFPDSSHCLCNHFPNVMQRTDHPEISSLGLPCPVQYLTMNDWTRQFESDNFPTIQRLYAAHGCADRVECRYFDTGHDYERPKREYTYWWLDRWLRGSTAAAPAAEPETTTLPVETVVQLAVEQPNDKGFGEIARLYRPARSEPAATWASAGDWETHRTSMAGVLQGLLGMHTVLPGRGELLSADVKRQDELVIEHVAFPSEGSLVVPSWIVRPAQTTVERLPVEIVLDARGKDALLAQSGDGSPRMRARGGSLVVLPDLRTFGEAFSTGTDNAAAQTTAWQRNSIVWGRPVAGMAVTDLQAVLATLAVRPDADMQRVKIVALGSGDLAIAGLFAMVLDPRIAESDLDFAGACYEKHNLLLVPRVLLYGDIPYWASLVADRRLTLRHVPTEAGDLQRVEEAFRVRGVLDHLSIAP